MTGNLIERRVLQVARDRMTEAPVIALQGARSVGKSTVLAQLAAVHGVRVIDLDDPTERARAKASPSDIVDGADPVCIDEYQHVPEVLQAIKAQLNRRHTNGRFVITGSSSFWVLPKGTQSLTGRIQLLEIMPFSQGEIDGIREDFLDLVFADPEHFRHGTSGTTREAYAERVCRGGLPLAINESQRTRARFYNSYVGTSLARDVRDLARVRQINVLPRLLERLASQSGQLLNITKAAQASEIEPRTADNYARLLEALFLVRRFPAWGRTLRSRANKAPKVHLVDSGLAAHLLGITPQKLERRDPATLSEYGHLLETFVVDELLKQASWRDDIRSVGHWRTSDGQEVDIVMERFDGSVICFEVKAAREVNAKDTAGLYAIRAALGDQFHAGFVLTTGEQSYRHDDRIYICPIDRLWATDSQHDDT